MYVYVHIYIYIHMNIHRVKAGGSPESNFFILRWILEILILYWCSQCFMASSQFDHRKCHMVCGQTWSLSAQKHPHVTTVWNGKKCLFLFVFRNYGFMYLLLFCWLLKNVIIHWRTRGDMTITPFFNLHIHKSCLKQLLQRTNIFSASTSSTHQHL